MGPVCFRRISVMVLLADLAGARGAARFGAVIEDDSVRAIARVRLAPCLSREVFERQLRAIAAVRSAVRVIGDVDYELGLECRDLVGLGIVLSSLRAVRGTEVASTALVLGDVAGLGRQVRPVADWGKAPRPRQARSA